LGGAVCWNNDENSGDDFADVGVWMALGGHGCVPSNGEGQKTKTTMSDDGDDKQIEGKQAVERSCVRGGDWKEIREVFKRGFLI